MKRRLAILVLFTILACVNAAPSMAADAFPKQPVEIYVPYTPGGAMDLLSRMIGSTAPKYLGQPVVTVNMPGAGGSVAAAHVINSKPDGYKLMITTNFFFTMTTKTQKIPFDPNNLVPLANLVEYRNGLCVKGDSPWKTLDDVLAFARQNPGKLRWSATGFGTSQYMYGILLFRKAKVEATGLPYNGTPEMISALLGGHTDASFITYGGVVDHVRSGAVRYVFTVGAKRYSSLPDVPCAGELGYDQIAKLPTYVGLFIHKNTPEPIKRQLLDVMNKTAQDPVFKKSLDNLGEEPRFAGPDFMAAAIKDSDALSTQLLKEVNLYVGKK